MTHESQQIEVRKSATFDIWLRRLADPGARIRILARIRRISLGNFGDVRSVYKGVSELRIDHGPGYRVYFTRLNLSVVLLCAGDKRTQAADIRRARRMVEELAD